MTTRDSHESAVRGGTAMSAHPGTTSKAVNITGWVLQVVLALLIAPGGLLKLIGDQAMVDLFSDIGAGQWLRYFVGICELAGGIGLLVPKVRALAAVGLFLLLVGATITNLFIIDESPVLSSLLAVVAAVIVYLRRHELPIKRS
ncbi:DoxX family protein [Micromonospora sediminicola]|uniref:DoxX family protein n=1 Tax=Micromonospora sediminicola TaxID=946078 RepID=UPI0033D8883E